MSGLKSAHEFIERGWGRARQNGWSVSDFIDAKGGKLAKGFAQDCIDREYWLLASFFFNATESKAILDFIAFKWGMKGGILRAGKRKMRKGGGGVRKVTEMEARLSIERQTRPLVEFIINDIIHLRRKPPEQIHSNWKCCLSLMALQLHQNSMFFSNDKISFIFFDILLKLPPFIFVTFISP